MPFCKKSLSTPSLEKEQCPSKCPLSTWSGPAGNDAGGTGDSQPLLCEEQQASSHMLTMLCSYNTALLKGCPSVGGVGSWLSQHGEPQEEGNMANPQGCPMCNVKTDRELKGVLWGYLGWDAGLDVSIQKPPWGELGSSCSFPSNC